MDIELLDRLESEHREVEGLLDQLEDAEGAESQRALVEELVSALAAHMEIEETEVYPQLATIDEEAVEEANTEHRLTREGLAKLQELIGAPGFGAAVEMVRAGIAHHVDEEEGETFPRLREAAGRSTDSDTDSASDSTSDTDSASKAELYEAAKRADIEGRSTMSKDELAEALDDA